MPTWLYFSRPQNVAFHNLCTDGILFTPVIKSLLGLSLKFCFQRPTTKGATTIDATRFRRDSFIKFFFAGQQPQQDFDSKLYVASNWQPDSNRISPEFRARISYFLSGLSSLFTIKHTPTNLLRSQHFILASLRARNDIIVWRSDKNLGPCVIEKSKYITQAIDDHLSDNTTYRQLSSTVAHSRMKAIHKILQNFIDRYFPEQKKPYSSEFDTTTSNTRRYLLRMLALSNANPFAYFYLLAKIHKTPWTTRPIIACRGSKLYGLGKWLDNELQKICKHLPFALRSSIDLVNHLSTLPDLPSNACLFTVDATSMYTNIDTTHAIQVISEFLKNSPITEIEMINTSAVMDAIRIIMNHNLFTFGNTFWVQLSGTAMGTPPAPMYATLYFAIHEEKVMNQYKHHLPIYQRYIDDGIGIWIDESNNTSNTINTYQDAPSWISFKNAFNSFGQLNWTFSPLKRTADFLDITLTINSSGRVDCQLYEKALNLYQYLPPHSAHAPGVLHGLITGMLYRIRLLTTNQTLQKMQIQSFFQRLCQRGYDPSKLRCSFYRTLATPIKPTLITTKNNSLETLTQTKLTRNLQITVPTTMPPLFIHLNYHPCDPRSAHIQRLFQDRVLQPPKEPPLSNLHNDNGMRCDINRLVVAYHRPRNLGELIAPTKLSDSQDVLQYIRTNTV